MIELTDQQRQELSRPEPIAIDPSTRETYVLVRQEIYDRLKALLSLDEYDPDEGLAHINEIMADDDASDPLLASYKCYNLATIRQRPVLHVIGHLSERSSQSSMPPCVRPLNCRSCPLRGVLT